MSSGLLPLHLGDLHAYETALLVLLAFGPFGVLGIVVAVVRRRDLAEEEREASGDDAGQDVPGSREDPAPETDAQARSGAAPGADRSR